MAFKFKFGVPTSADISKTHDPRTTMKIVRITHTEIVILTKQIRETQRFLFQLLVVYMLFSDSLSWHEQPERCKASFSREGYSIFVPYRCFNLKLKISVLYRFLLPYRPSSCIVFSSIWGNTLITTEPYSKNIKIFQYFMVFNFETILSQQFAVNDNFSIKLTSPTKSRL